jgi:hypothetical protein
MQAWELALNHFLKTGCRLADASNQPAPAKPTKMLRQKSSIPIRRWIALIGGTGGLVQACRMYGLFCVAWLSKSARDQNVAFGLRLFCVSDNSASKLRHHHRRFLFRSDQRIDIAIIPFADRALRFDEMRFL